MSSTTPETIPVAERILGSWRISLSRLPYPQAQLSTRYDQASETWQHRLTSLGYPRAYRSVSKHVLARQALCTTSPLRILDCGIGSGALSCALLSAWNAPCELHGVDISCAMLEQAHTYLKAHGHEAHLQHANVCALPYPDASFDLVATAHVLEHLPHPKKALLEMQRVLRPGGTLLLIATRRTFLGRWIQIGWRTHTFTSSQLHAMLASVALQSVSIHPLSGGPWWCERMSLACHGQKATPTR